MRCYVSVFMLGCELVLLPGYEIQKKTRSGDWVAANRVPIPGDAKEAKVTGLPEGEELEFRVVALNDAGPGEPSKSTGPHKMRDPVCKCHTR